MFAYNLLQFCGHSWTLCNILARILRFGRGKLRSLPRARFPWV